jgi:hypothetical protein
VTPRWLVTLFGWVVAVGVAALAAWPAAAAAEPAAATERTPLLVIAVPGLLWSDISDMPRLAAFLARADVAELSVKSGAPRTSCAIGLLTLSAGQRVGAGPMSCFVDQHTRTSLAERNLEGPYEAVLGSFGEQLRAAGYRTASIDQYAGALLADQSGRLDLPWLADEREAFADADAVAAVLPELGEESGSRRAAAHRVDARIGMLLDQAPPGGVVAVVGSSDTSTVERPHLHVLGISNRDNVQRQLTSVNRPPYVLLTDVGATLLQRLQVPVTGDGHPARVAHGVAPSVAEMADDDKHARAASLIGGPLRTSLWIAVAVLAALVAATRRWPRIRPVALALGWPLALAPVASYAVQVVPWWRHGGLAYALLLASCCLVVGLVLWSLGRVNRAAVIVPSVITAAILAVDQWVGAPLQLSAPMGDNPLVAGRFRGMGNTAFALFATSVVLLAVALAAFLLARGRPVVAWAATAALLLVAVLTDGLPMIGDDFGGSVVLLTVGGVLLLLLAPGKVTVRRVAVAAGAVVLLLAGIVAVDLLRPVAQETHIGHFARSLLHGDGTGVPARKLSSAARSLTNVPALIVVVVTAAALLAHRQRLRATHPLTVRVVLPCLALLALLGSGFNDSGITVAAAVALATTPLLLLVLERSDDDPPAVVRDHD